MTEPLRPGVYRHYKGGLYRLFGTSRDASDTTRDGTICAVYMDIGTGRFYHRPVMEFQGMAQKMVQIPTPSGLPAPDLVPMTVPRFQWVGD